MFYYPPKSCVSELATVSKIKSEYKSRTQQLYRKEMANLSKFVPMEYEYKLPSIYRSNYAFDGPLSPTMGHINLH